MFSAMIVKTEVADTACLNATRYNNVQQVREHTD